MPSKLIRFALVPVLMLGACVVVDEPDVIKECLRQHNCSDNPPVVGGSVAGGGATGGHADFWGGMTAGSGGGTRESSAGAMTATGGHMADTGGEITVMGGTGSGLGGEANLGGTTRTGDENSAGGIVATADVLTSKTGGMVSSGGRTAASDVSRAGGASATSGDSAGAGGSTVSPPPPIAFPGRACTTETRDGSCTGSAVCYKFCGPDTQGYKTLTCNGRRYSEGSCTFSSTTDYACYGLAGVDLCATTPMANTSCSLAPCQPCGGSSGITYYDSNGDKKTGYCVCTNGNWSCASTSAWPCPGKTGCQEGR